MDDDLDKLEIELKNKVKMKAKVKAIKKGLKTFFVNFTGATSAIGTLASIAMFLNAMTNGDMRTGLIWFLATTICLATLLTIWDRWE